MAKQKYKLVNPERFVLILLVLVIIILLCIQCGKKKNTSTDSEESSSPIIQTIDGENSEETGTKRSVSTIALDGVSGQMAAYMTSMLMSNLENVKSSMAGYLEGNTDVAANFDPTHYRYIVAIDASHGGSDKGYAVDDLVEKKITLSVAQHMINYLNAHNDGYYFLLTRSSDTTMTNEQRLKIANAYSVDCLITLRVNASEEELGGTVGTYYSASPSGGSDDDEDGEGENSSSGYNERDALSERLAQELMEAAADGFGMWYRYVEVEEGPMLETEFISCTVYMGYMTYYLDHDLLASESAQAAAGEAMGQALLDFLAQVAPEKSEAELARDGESSSSGESSENP